MLKKNKIFLIVVLSLLISINLVGSGDLDIKSIFPEINGMKMKGTPEVYTPDNLYEYINGAADVFLSYDFQELASLTYEDKANHSLTIDIYRHSNNNNGFGIYSQEKPAKGEFLEIGSQGYYEQGILNFLSGKYYIKMSAYDLGENDKDIMMAAAKDLAGKFKGKKGFPQTLTFFSRKDMVPNSQRYVAVDFLGHSFLHSAFVVDYNVANKKYKVFIIEAGDAGSAKAILDKYTSFAKSKGSVVNEKMGYISFMDPYYRSKGSINLKLKGKYLWGTFGDDEQVHIFMKEIDKNVPTLK